MYMTNTQAISKQYWLTELHGLEMLPSPIMYRALIQ